MPWLLLYLFIKESHKTILDSRGWKWIPHLDGKGKKIIAKTIHTEMGKKACPFSVIYCTFVPGHHWYIFKRVVFPSLICHILIFPFKKLTITFIMFMSKISYYIFFQTKCPSTVRVWFLQSVTFISDTEVRTRPWSLVSVCSPGLPPLSRLAVREILLNLLKQSLFKYPKSLAEERLVLW